MNKRLIKMLGGTALVASAAAFGIASASARDAADAKAAAEGAAKATGALARHDAGTAIAEAERSVALAPRDAGYRLLLGRSYLAAGRFVSARTAFGDTLALAPANGKAALNLTLTQIATGDWAGARRTLDEHGAGIAAADRGLALALAGDPNGAVQLLTQVARSPEATVKVRQNLALSLALAGDWAGARSVAAVDMSPADLDARLAQWAAFSRPKAASDQVAALLGLTPAADRGQPVQLALAGQPGIAVAAVAAPVAPVAVSDPVPAARPAPVAVAAADPATQPGFVAAPVVFGPRAEVVQPLPATMMASNQRSYVRPGPVKVVLDTQGKATPLARVAQAAPAAEAPAMAAAVPTIQPRPGAAKMRLAAATAAPASHGNWFVQLGAFGSSAVARDAWTRAAHRMPALAARGPSGASFTANRITFYRLSVGGFARGEADALCRRYRATGGACFVRAGAHDQVAEWSKKGVQVAAR